MKNKHIVIGALVGVVIAGGFYMYVKKYGLGKLIAPPMA